MTRISVHSVLRYDVYQPTSRTLDVLAAENAARHVDEHRLVFEPGHRRTPRCFEPAGHDVVRFTADPGAVHCHLRRDGDG